MAGMLHCACSLTRPRLLQPLRRDHFPISKLDDSGKLSCSFKVDQSVQHLTDTFEGPPEIQSMLSHSNCQEDKNQKFRSLKFLTSSVLMFSIPCQALAETCEADNSFFNMPLLLSVALIGATVGGLLARQRRGELKKLNDQLRQINAALRRQAKVESYAPSLSYAPIGGRISENEVIVDQRKEDLISKLKMGKNFLRNQDPDKAFKEFETALELAQNLKDPIEEKKAARGLGASLQRQGKYREAIKYHSMVLPYQKERERTLATQKLMERLLTVTLSLETLNELDSSMTNILQGLKKTSVEYFILAVPHIFINTSSVTVQ